MKAQIAAIRGLLCFIVAVLGSCASPQPAPFASGHRPGDILHIEPLPGAPAGATATRVLYVSTSLDGSTIAVSGLVIVPSVPAPPSGRPVLAWLHATTGVDRACAPSLGPAPFAQIQGLPAFLAAGYAVVATDYAGLGGPGTHPYLVGISEARAALDSVRAAGRLPGAQAGPRFAVWGHSQGGHAALFAAELARAYAPELRLVGVAAAAPVTDVAALVGQPGQDPLWGALLSYTIWSWSHVLGAAPDMIVPAVAQPTIERTAKNCLESAEELHRLLSDAAPLRGEPVTPDARWRTLLAENAPTPQPGGPPVFLAQGDQDPVIPAPLTRDFARRLCREHTPVRYLAMPGVDHYTAAARSSATAADWIAARFAGVSPPDDCAALQYGADMGRRWSQTAASQGTTLPLLAPVVGPSCAGTGEVATPRLANDRVVARRSRQAATRSVSPATLDGRSLGPTSKGASRCSRLGAGFRSLLYRKSIAGCSAARWQFSRTFLLSFYPALLGPAGNRCRDLALILHRPDQCGACHTTLGADVPSSLVSAHSVLDLERGGMTLQIQSRQTGGHADSGTPAGVILGDC